MSVDPKSFGKVAVLMGGFNAEHEVSMHSGEGILHALIKKGVDAHQVIVDDHIRSALERGGYDRVFNVLHGRGCEDGKIQALLEELDIPYTGSGVEASELTMNKYRSYQVVNQHGIKTPKYQLIQSEADLSSLDKKLRFPMAIKPLHEGSSNGVACVKSAAELRDAFDGAKRFKDDIMADEWIVGAEYSLPIIGETVLPSIKISTPNREFYDYNAKYVTHDTVYECPSDLDEASEKELRALALKAFKVLGARDWGRADFMRDKQGVFYFLELNTVPGMTETSLTPKAAKVMGVNYEDLVFNILCLSLEHAKA